MIPSVNATNAKSATDVIVPFSDRSPNMVLYLINFIKTSAPIKEPQILAIISRNSKSLPSKNKYWQTSISIPTPIVITNDISNGHFRILFNPYDQSNCKTK